MPISSSLGVASCLNAKLLFVLIDHRACQGVLLWIPVRVDHGFDGLLSVSDFQMKGFGGFWRMSF